MSSNSKIEWTDASWNPVTGCTKVSPGCANCYAETFAERFRGVPGHPYETGFDLTLRPERLELPLSWKKSKRIFVNSMSDLFHKDVPNDYILKVFETMRQAHWHQFQILTKRAARLESIDPQIEWPDNVWMGVSVESKKYRSRIDHLRRTHARVKFLSIEPLIEDLEGLDLDGIDWVIVGGESGRKARPMEMQWILDIQRSCEEQEVAFFFKQWGGTNKKKAGRLLNGRTYDEMPTQLLSSN